MEVVYFELNNWFSGRDYPDAEPFLSWMECNKENKYYIQFRDESWIEENRLVVVESLVEYLIEGVKVGNIFISALLPDAVGLNLNFCAVSVFDFFNIIFKSYLFIENIFPLSFYFQ